MNVCYSSEACKASSFLCNRVSARDAVGSDLYSFSYYMKLMLPGEVGKLEELVMYFLYEFEGVELFCLKKVGYLKNSHLFPVAQHMTKGTASGAEGFSGVSPEDTGRDFVHSPEQVHRERCGLSDWIHDTCKGRAFWHCRILIIRIVIGRGWVILRNLSNARKQGRGKGRSSLNGSRLFPCLSSLPICFLMN